MLGPPASAVLALDLYNKKVNDAICKTPIGTTSVLISATGPVCHNPILVSLMCVYPLPTLDLLGSHVKQGPKLLKAVAVHIFFSHACCVKSGGLMM